jgi:plastocyanin
MRRRWLVLAAVPLVAVVLAGCGGSSSSPATTAAAPPATTAAAPPATTAASGGASSSGGTLDGVVGPGFTITLTQDGKPVTQLSAGTYTINVDDKANIHNFHLTGPGVDKATDVSGTGTQTWTVDLKAGKYHYQCDPHAGSMNGDFTVS